MRHRLDPPQAHRAAAALGWLEARGFLSRGECLTALLAAHLPDRMADEGLAGASCGADAAARSVDASGLRARLAHRLADSAWSWEQRRWRALAAIRRGVAPLLARGAGREAILGTAQAALQAAETALEDELTPEAGLLGPAELEGVVLAEVARQLRGGSRPPRGGWRHG